MTDVDQQTLIVYLWYTVPIQWVNWQYEVSDESAKQRLNSVLADPSTGSLVDLRKRRVRKRVMGVVLRNKALQCMILPEARQFLDSVTKQIAEALREERDTVAPARSSKKAKNDQKRLRTRVRWSLVHNVAVGLGIKDSEQ